MENPPTPHNFFFAHIEILLILVYFIYLTPKNFVHLFWHPDIFCEDIPVWDVVGIDYECEG